jgi:GLPGLI family protein
VACAFRTGFLIIIGTEFTKSKGVMKRFTTFLIILLFSFSSLIAQDSKIVGDCTVTYNLAIDDAKADPNVVKALSGATKVLYIKGSKSRSDLNSNGFQQTTIYDSKSDSIIVLREMGANKYISYLSGSKLAEQNRKFEGITFTETNDTKIILGYECKRVVAKLQDGTTYNVYYTPAIVPSNKGYEYQFKNLPGFVLEYDGEFENGKSTVKYTASKISITPVPNAKFDIPKTGYRVI